MDPPIDIAQKNTIATRVPFLFCSSNPASPKPSSTTTNSKPFIHHHQPSSTPPMANLEIHNHHHQQPSTQPQPPPKNPNETKIQTHQRPSTKCVWLKKKKKKKKKKEISGFDSPAKLNLWSWLSLIHRWSFRSLWSISLTIQPGLNSIRRRSLISSLGSVRFARKAWFLCWRETLLDGTKSKPSPGDHGLGVLRLLLWWWWWNWAELEKGGKKEPDKEPDKGRKKEKTEKERSQRKKEKEKSGRRKWEDKVKEM